KALKEGLASYHDLSDSLRKILTGDQPGRVALKMYTVKLSLLTSGVLQQFEFKGWRFLASDAKDGIVVDVAASSQSLGPPPRVTAVQRGPNAAKVIEELGGVLALPEAQRTDAELSFVNISSLMTEMIWIKTSGDAWVVPYHTLIKAFTKQPYKLADFASIAG